MSVLVGPKRRRSGGNSASTSQLSREGGDPFAPKSFGGRELSDAEMRQGYLDIADRFERVADAAKVVGTGLAGIKPSPALGPNLPSAAAISAAAAATQAAASAAAQQMKAEAARDFKAERFEKDLRDRIDRDRSTGHREGRERAERVERAERFNGAC